MLAPRWRVVVALFTVTSCIATAVSTFGVFLPVLSEAFGWSRGAVSVALSISLVLGGVAAFPVGRIADRRGPRAGLATTVAIGRSEEHTSELQSLAYLACPLLPAKKKN